jgi:23S rRNA pseudouridine1911/1915/1917 synthase
MMAIRFLAHKAGVRLDKFVSQQCPELTRARAQKLIARGQILINNRLAKANSKLNIGDEVAITLPLPTPKTPIPKNIPLSIVYENQDLMVVDKPAGIVVHPAPGHPDHTLVNAILAHCHTLPDADSSLRPGIVHRLDKDTSGLMVIAKNARAKAELQSQLKDHSMAKHYLVLVNGNLTPQQGAIEAPVGRHPTNRKRMVISSGGKEAQTSYRVIEYVANYTLLDVAPITGRTHQIRVHLSAIGHPVMGDAVYGRKSPLLSRQFVHSYLLGFRLPGSSEYVEFKSELPADLKQALKHICLDRHGFG